MISDTPGDEAVLEPKGDSAGWTARKRPQFLSGAPFFFSLIM